MIDSSKTPAYAINTFAVDIYAELKSSNDNLLFSPYSIHTALAMTYGGARNKTEREMAQALYLLPDKEISPPLLNTLDSTPQSEDRRQTSQLHVANSLWPHNAHPFLQKYLDWVREFYGTTIRPVDYVQSPDASRKIINSWVAEKTRDKITDLIGPGAISRDTVMVLCNAVYFKGDWAVPFDTSRTRSLPFQLTGGKKVNVQMMRRLGPFTYGETDGIQLLEIPYEGNDLSMVVVLPRSPERLSKMEKHLTIQTLNSWLSQLRIQQVRVYLPKFKMSWGAYDLVPNLQKLGLNQAFSPGNADFSGMDGTKSLFISMVLHKAFIGVDEQGTEAAASTAVGMRKTAMSPVKPAIFRADHPFMFLIRDRKTGCILFMGKLMNPTVTAAAPDY